MKYCTQCGHELIEDAKFCASCGAKTELSNGNVGKPLMFKGESKSLKDKAISFGENALQKEVQKKIQGETSNYVKSKLEESFSSNTIQENPTTNTVSKNQTTENKTISNKNTINKWTWIYVILNGILVYFGHQSDQVIGVLLFSILILGIVFFRRNNDKPYNWLVKIILVIQLIFLIALVAEGIEYISYITLLFLGLLVTDLILLFKGNNS